jgi:AcrR family transcriptional regulator
LRRRRFLTDAPQRAHPGESTLSKEIKDTRDVILECALRLFATKGYHLTKVSDIVRESGCAQATFYWHFKSKLDMTRELFESGQHAMVAAIDRGYRAHVASTEDMLANTRAWLIDLLTFASERRYFMALLLAKGYGADPVIDTAISGVRAALYESLRRNIEQAVTLGMLRDLDKVDVRAAFVYHTIEGTIGWWLFGHGHDLAHQPSIEVQDLADQLARYEFFGLTGK